MSKHGNRKPQTSAPAKPVVETKPTEPVVTEPVVQAAPMILKAKHVAARHGMKPQALRRVLRSMREYADGMHTNYAWDESSQAGKDALARIAAKLASNAAERQAKVLEAQAALASKATEVAQAAPVATK